MPIRIERMQDEPIIFIEARSPVDVKTEMPDAIARFVALLDAADQPLWDVTDAQGFTATFSDMVSILGIISRTDLGMIHHRHFAGLALVTDSEVIRTGLEALGQVQYGGIVVRTFPTVDEAIDFVRTESAARV